MFGITISEAAAICGGSVYGINTVNEEITSVVIDSRKVTPGAMFVAYRGEKNDGHQFVAAAFQKGAICSLVEELIADVDSPMILVSNVQRALEQIMEAFRHKIKIPVVGITGSVGKTTAKEMIASVLSERFCVHKTEGNFNNRIGVPISISRIKQEHEVAILEMGINHFDEMRHLGCMVQPDVMVYTNIGHAHLEFLGDLKGVLRAKTEVLEFMREDALLVLNGDDPMLNALECPQKKLYYGVGEQCDVRAVNICHNGMGYPECDIEFRGRSIHVELPVFGEHMIFAALEGAAVGLAFSLSDEEIQKGILKYQPVGRRFACFNTGFLYLVDDCYNSNPDSLGASIRSLCCLPGRHVAILGDMLELGEDSVEMHRRMGQLARELGVDCLITCGEFAAFMAESYGTGAMWFESVADVLDFLPRLLQENDAVLVKASLRMKFDRISEAIKVLS